VKYTFERTPNSTHYNLPRDLLTASRVIDDLASELFTSKMVHSDFSEDASKFKPKSSRICIR